MWTTVTGAAVALAAATGIAVLVMGGDDRGGGAPHNGGSPGTLARDATRPEGGASGPRPTASPSPMVNGRPQPMPVKVPGSASGRYAVVRGTAAPPAGSRGPVVRYRVEVERGLPFDGAQFAAEVHRVLNDPRSWGHGGRMRFARVGHGPVRFTVALSSPALTDRMCSPLNTGGGLSCRAGDRSVINARRWGEGAATYRGDLATYREYVINHEVGHALGHDHEHCPGPGRRAPVMVQQTKSLEGCRPGAWPFPDR